MLLSTLLLSLSTISPRRADVRVYLQRGRTPMAGAASPSSLPLPLDLLATTFLGGKDLERVYRASEDGWSALDFHRQSDSLGCLVVVGRTESGTLVGGFNPTGWESRDDYRATPRAFLFCADASRSGGDEGTAEECIWTSCPVLGPGDIAIFDYARGGPQFGAADLVIGPPLTPTMGGIAGPDVASIDPNVEGRTAGDCRSCTSLLGGSYARLPDGEAALPVGPLVELEAWANAAFAGDGPPSKAAAVSVKVAQAPNGRGAGAEQQGDKVGWWPF